LRFWEEFICIFSLTALHIDAEVVRWVYTAGSEKPSATSKTDAQKTLTNQPGEFFSLLLAGFGAPSTPSPMQPKEPINLFETTSSNIALTIFVANVDVQVDKKMTAELLRSTKKNPPSRLRYELIYVSSTVVKRILKVGSYIHLDGEGRIRLECQGGGESGTRYGECISRASG
jgi:hypothetical protein